MTKTQRLSILVVVLLLAVLAFPLAARTSTSTTVVKLWVGNSVMSIGAVRQPIDSQGTKPYIVEGRTLVPIRAVIEAFGGSVAWNAATRMVTVSLGDNSLDLWIGKSLAALNGTSLPIDSANPRVFPVINGGRTMLPLRFVSESLGIDVQYEAATKMITLTYTVGATYLPAPSLLVPGPDAVVSSLTPRFEWTAVAGATDYVFWLGNGTSFAEEAQLLRDWTGSNQRVLPGSLLEDGGTYTWAVYAANVNEGGEWSDDRHFTVKLSAVAPPPAPRLLAPLNLALVDSSGIVLTWVSVADADSYRIQILRDGIEVHAASGLSSTMYAVPAGVLGSGSYSWSAAAHNAGGWSSWFNPFYFQARAKLTVSDIAKYVDRTVLIEVQGFKNGEAFSASGSGFFIATDGRIVTNYHVIDATTQGTVTLNGGQKYDIASVLGYNKDQDVAVIRINGTGFPVCTMGDSNKAAVGDPVVAIGSPLGVQNTVSEGIVSKLWDDGDLQITAPISPGSSGGALFNMYGEVIGVTTWKIRDGENMNGAVPVNYVRSLDTTLNLTLPQLFQREYPGAAVLAAPTLVSPAPNATLSTVTPTLSWTAVSGATKYVLRIWVGSAISPPPIWPGASSSPYAIDTVLAATSYAVPLGTLSSGVQYCWTVIAGNSLEWSDFMKIPGSVYVPAFTVQAGAKLSAPILATPTDDMFHMFYLDQPMTFQWSSVAGADYYILWIGTGISGTGTAIYHRNVYGTSWGVQQSELPTGQVYTWAVMAADADSAPSSSDWSADRHFSIDAVEGVQLVSPSNHSTIYYGPTLSWLPFSGATSYSVSVYRGPNIDLGAVVLRESLLSGTSYSVPPLTLAKGETYCWRVTAFRVEYLDGGLHAFLVADSALYVVYVAQ